MASTLDEQGRMAVELCYGGGAQWCMAATQAIHRTRGVQRSSEGGMPVWDISVPNCTLGQK